jgi:tetratricopeptide (TPR) repeat protein
MTTTPAPADLQRWSEELARNPASLAFLPLARAYRRQGRLDHAMRLCMRGLEQHPTHVEAHALLALLYLETGDRAKAADEWSTVLRLKPGNFEALRGMGFRYLEQGDIARAKQHLERAALIRPNDTAVQEALRLLRVRQEEGGIAIRTENTRAGGEAAAEPVFLGLDDAGATDVLELTEAEAAAPAQDPQTSARGWADGQAGRSAEPKPRTDEGDPTRVFDSMLRGPVLGVLLMDARGFVLAGRLTGEATARAEEVGALVGGTAEEVARTVEHLDLLRWKGMLLECGKALLHVSPVGEDAMILVAVRRESPRGWVLRTAHLAASLAEPFLRSYV